ncbi:MAG: elongator complex protein 3 [Chloroflexota bacterium]
MDKKSWLAARQHTPEAYAVAQQALEAVRQGLKVEEAIRRFRLPDGGYLPKHLLVATYKQLTESGAWKPDPTLLGRIRLKPVRTLSGVTTVTVLTKPYPCPGQCIFCPTDERMPKSYLPDEPGARRGLEHAYDPYTQVAARLRALDDVGHPTDKVELLILGGTWSSYRSDYQAWFVQRCFEAMNGAPLEGSAGTLETVHQANETASHRNVGLAIETRPDEVNPAELAHLRRLGVTKVQMGAQSLDDRILTLNKRGHSVQETHRAAALLRAAGFKIVLHWMPNLLGATPQSDREDFARLWDGLCPDEIKIYPTQLLANAELYEYWLRGEYTPYTTEELIELIVDIKTTIPPYCRVNRVIRDIPSTEVVEGNKRTSLRQDVQAEMARRGTRCNCIRCREVRGKAVDPSTLCLDEQVYTAGGAQEHFLSFVTPDEGGYGSRLAGFLRLSLPGPDSPDPGMADLFDGRSARPAAIIREVHVYGQSLEIGDRGAVPASSAVQHAGLGTQLLERAGEIARRHGYTRMAVIAAVGTRCYYLQRGFERGALYLVKNL